MKKFSKKALSTILAVLLVMSTLSSFAAYAENPTTAADTTTQISETEIYPTAPSTAPQQVNNGWSSDKKYYYIDGKAVTGMRKIGGHKYFFSSKGR